MFSLYWGNRNRQIKRSFNRFWSWQSCQAEVEGKNEPKIGEDRHRLWGLAWCFLQTPIKVKAHKPRRHVHFTLFLLNENFLFLAIMKERKMKSRWSHTSLEKFPTNWGYFSLIFFVFSFDINNDFSKHSVSQILLLLLGLSTCKDTAPLHLIRI